MKRMVRNTRNQTRKQKDWVYRRDNKKEKDNRIIKLIPPSTNNHLQSNNKYGLNRSDWNDASFDIYRSVYSDAHVPTSNDSADTAANNVCGSAVIDTSVINSIDNASDGVSDATSNNGASNGLLDNGISDDPSDNDVPGDTSDNDVSNNV